MDNYDYIINLGHDSFSSLVYNKCIQCKDENEFKDWLYKIYGERLNHTCEYVSNEILGNKHNNVCRSCKYGLNTNELGDYDYNCCHATKYDKLKGENE